MNLDFKSTFNSYFASRSYLEDMEELMSSLDRFIRKDSFLRQQNIEKLLVKKVLVALIENSFKRAILGATSLDLHLTLLLAGEGALEVIVVVTFTAGKIIFKRIVSGTESDVTPLLPV